MMFTLLLPALLGGNMKMQLKFGIELQNILEAAFFSSIRQITQTNRKKLIASSMSFLNQPELKQLLVWILTISAKKIELKEITF